MRSRRHAGVPSEDAGDADDFGVVAFGVCDAVNGEMLGRACGELAGLIGGVDSLGAGAAAPALDDAEPLAAALLGAPPVVGRAAWPTSPSLTATRLTSSTEPGLALMCPRTIFKIGRAHV